MEYERKDKNQEIKKEEIQRIEKSLSRREKTERKCLKKVKD